MGLYGPWYVTYSMCKIKTYLLVLMNAIVCRRSETVLPEPLDIIFVRFTLRQIQLCFPCIKVQTIFDHRVIWFNTDKLNYAM